MTSAALGQVITAQEIDCLQAPATKPGQACEITRTGQTTTIAVQARIGDVPQSGVKVEFEAGGRARSSSVTDASGVATTQWFELEAAPDARLTATATIGSKYAERPILLKKAKKQVAALLNFSKGSRKTGLGQHWYAGKQLTRPIRAWLDSIGPPHCGDTFVVFKALGEDASASPDTSRAFDTDGKCAATAFWKLGKVIGEQYMRVTVAGDDEHAVVINARARATPWLAAGLAVAWLPEIIGAKSTSQSFQVVRKSADADTTFTETKTVARPDTLARLQIHPILGINTPIFTAWDWIRWSIAADAVHPTTDWFTGLSLTQMGPGIRNEDVGADLHLMLHVARRDELKDVAGCVASAACDTHKRTVVGAAVSVQLNAGSFLGAFTGLFK